MHEHTLKFLNSSRIFSCFLKTQLSCLQYKNLLLGTRKYKVKININVNRIHKNNGLHLALCIYIHRCLPKWMYSCMQDTHTSTSHMYVYVHICTHTYTYSQPALQCSWAKDGGFGFCSLAPLLFQSLQRQEPPNSHFNGY